MVCTILINSAFILESDPEKDVVTNAILLMRKGTIGKADLLPQALQLVSGRNRIPILAPQYRANKQLLFAEQGSLIFHKGLNFHLIGSSSVNMEQLASMSFSSTVSLM